MKLYLAQAHPGLKPAAAPAAQVVMDAVHVLVRQELAVYQRLYREGLTQPGDPAMPFTVRINVKHLGCIQVAPFGNEAYAFNVSLAGPASDLDAVVPKARALYEAINSDKAKVHSLACCPLAEFSPCVCYVSFRCFVHGSACHGSHD